MTTCTTLAFKYDFCPLVLVINRVKTEGTVKICGVVWLWYRMVSYDRYEMTIVITLSTSSMSAVFVTGNRYSIW